LFLPLFVFISKLIQCAMKADADAVIDAFGKNEAGEERCSSTEVSKN
jgi:hypothetical protein